MQAIYDFGIASLEQVAERITQGAVQGFEDLTAEHLAASYAASAAIEAGYGVEQGDIEAHLEILVDAGAEFDFEAAAVAGVELAKAAS